MKPPTWHTNPFTGDTLYGQRIDVGDGLHVGDVFAAHRGWVWTRNVDRPLDPADEDQGRPYVRPISPAATAAELLALRQIIDSTVISYLVKDQLRPLYEKLTVPVGDPR